MSSLVKIKSLLQPEARALATAASFELFQSVTGISESNLKEGLLFLSKSDKENEPGNIISRRATCKEVADLIPSDQTRGDITCVQAWGKWVEYLSAQINIVPDEQKGRYAAMLATAKRELEELNG